MCLFICVVLFDLCCCQEVLLHPPDLQRGRIVLDDGAREAEQRRRGEVVRALATAADAGGLLLDHAPHEVARAEERHQVAHGELLQEGEAKALPDSGLHGPEGREEVLRLVRPEQRPLGGAAHVQQGVRRRLDGRLLRRGGRPGEGREHELVEAGAAAAAAGEALDRGEQPAGAARGPSGAEGGLRPPGRLGAVLARGAPRRPPRLLREVQRGPAEHHGPLQREELRLQLGVRGHGAAAPRAPEERGAPRASGALVLLLLLLRGSPRRDLGFSNGTLERRYSRIMLSPPQNVKTYLGHEG